MTTQHEMEMAYAAQKKVITALNEIGDPDLATRLERCMTARQHRHCGDGWPYSCRSAACVWCRRAMIRGWWFGICEWSSADMASLAIIPVLSPVGLPDAGRWLRRGLRGVRDRTARRWKRWRTMSFAGLMSGDHKAFVMIAHGSVDRREVEDVLRHRWPDVVVKELQHEEPTWAMTANEAVELGRCRRGIEPLRVLVRPQVITRVTVAPAPAPVILEPMPVVV